MSRIKTFLKELENESLTTRKMLSRIPDDSYDWKPHPKSMSMRSLATHIAELPTWITMTLTTDELDFESAPYSPPTIDNTAEILVLFEKSLKNGRSQLTEANESKLNEPWTMRSGSHIISTDAKAEVIAERGISFYFDDQPEMLKNIPANVGVMLFRNEGNFDFADRKWMLSNKTGKIVQ